MPPEYNPRRYFPFNFGFIIETKFLISSGLSKSFGEYFLFSKTAIASSAAVSSELAKGKPSFSASAASPLRKFTTIFPRDYRFSRAKIQAQPHRVLSSKRRNSYAISYSQVTRISCL